MITIRQVIDPVSAITFCKKIVAIASKDTIPQAVIYSIISFNINGITICGLVLIIASGIEWAMLADAKAIGKYTQPRINKNIPAISGGLPPCIINT